MPQATKRPFELEYLAAEPRAMRRLEEQITQLLKHLEIGGSKQIAVTVKEGANNMVEVTPKISNNGLRDKLRVTSRGSDGIERDTSVSLHLYALEIYIAKQGFLINYHPK